ncbi:MAG TPA: hypothetical protein ENG69_05270 [Candidatus Korarchaeota archaeon]|nr:hypothetical protein [Candidatus Korarchaeota archaeon]
MRSGISRVAVEAAILLIIIVVAIMLVGPGKALSSAVTSRLGLVAPANLQAMGGGVAGESSTSIYFVVFVRNLGPNTVGDPNLDDSYIPSMWEVYVNGASCVVRVSYIRQHNQDPSLEDNAAMEPYEIWEFGFRCPKSSVPPAQEYKVAIYGPSGVRAYYTIEGG